MLNLNLNKESKDILLWSDQSKSTPNVYMSDEESKQFILNCFEKNDSECKNINKEFMHHLNQEEKEKYTKHKDILLWCDANKYFMTPIAYNAEDTKVIVQKMIDASQDGFKFCYTHFVEFVYYYLSDEDKKLTDMINLA